MKDPADPMSLPRRSSLRLPQPLWFLVAAIVVVVVPIGLRIGLPGFIRQAEMLAFLGVISAQLIRVQSHRQQTAIRVVERLGGTVETSPFVSKWLPWAHVIVKVDLSGSMVADADLARMKGLESLERLNLDCTNVTDAGLSGLARITSLRFLDLNNTLVTDEGLVHLEALLNLQGLSLANTLLTDAGLMHLEGLLNLQVLSLANTPVTDAGVSHLKGLLDLQLLSLGGTQVTDAGIGKLTLELPNLTFEP